MATDYKELAKSFLRNTVISNHVTGRPGNIRPEYRMTSTQQYYDTIVNELANILMDLDGKKKQRIDKAKEINSLFNKQISLIISGFNIDKNQSKSETVNNKRNHKKKQLITDITNIENDKFKLIT